MRREEEGKDEVREGNGRRMVEERIRRRKRGEEEGKGKKRGRENEERRTRKKKKKREGRESKQRKEEEARGDGEKGEGRVSYVRKKPWHSHKALSVCLRTQGSHDISVVTL